METSTTESLKQKQTYRLEFFGQGSDYFGIMIVNWLLTLVTFGLYYPWARAKRLKYVYGQTALNDERFHFSGTGKEMFRGFIKVLLFYVAVLFIYGIIISVLQAPILGILFLYLAIFALLPFAIHGSLKYRMSRTSYRGIRFGYRGDRKELTQNVLKWVFFTIITFGIYGAWLLMNIRRYTQSNIRYGEVEFSYDGNGGDWFWLNVKGYFLTIFTLGIYAFWWQRNIFAYFVDHMAMARGDQKIQCRSVATAGGFFELLVVNFLLTIFTLGFGKAWADMRTQRFICDSIILEGDIDIDAIHQTEEEYTNAFGEDAVDFFEIDLA